MTCLASSVERQNGTAMLSPLHVTDDIYWILLPCYYLQAQLTCHNKFTESIRNFLHMREHFTRRSLQFFELLETRLERWTWDAEDWETEDLGSVLRAVLHCCRSRQHHCTLSSKLSVLPSALSLSIHNCQPFYRCAHAPAAYSDVANNTTGIPCTICMHTLAVFPGCLS